MRIVIYPHSMEFGGSQRNAIDIATALRERGHELTVFCPPGPLLELVTERGLRYELAPLPRIRPSFAVMRRLCSVVEAADADVVHGFEWPPAVEALFGPERQLGVPAICTVMSMSVAPFLPSWLPLTVGTEGIFRTERTHRAHVILLEPPVDTEHDRPVDQVAAKRRLGIGPETLVISLVTRLAKELKREGILSAVEAAGALNREFPVTLVIAGDGPIRAEVEDAAARANAAAGTRAVLVTGNLVDPRPVYDAADVALGMGGSALRSMAFGKPLIVQGEHGFWRVLEANSLSSFTENGWFGVGSVGDARDGAARLGRLLRPLLVDAETRDALGSFSRATVEARYGLPAAAELLEGFYLEAVQRSRVKPVPASRLLAPYLAVTGYDMRRKVRRRLGGVVSDDFNSLASIQLQSDRSVSR